MPGLVSIHDLMPHTLERVERILEWLQRLGVPPVTLLVVPGCPWQPWQLERLRELAAEGHHLAAHGWVHTTRPRRLYHRLHAALISRRVAEHLDLDSAGILQLLRRSGQWFSENGLPSPQLYVPPAWALGSVRRDDLVRAPFAMIETLRGILHLKATTGSAAEKVSFQPLPLTGYEADTHLRSYFLRNWNARQCARSVRQQQPLRISIHPDDLELRLANQLEAHIRAQDAFVPYA
jgi:predicted deacetylase